MSTFSKAGWLVLLLSVLGGVSWVLFSPHEGSTVVDVGDASPNEATEEASETVDDLLDSDASLEE